MLRRRHFQFGVRMCLDAIEASEEIKKIHPNDDWFVFGKCLGSKLVIPRTVKNANSFTRTPVGNNAMKIRWSRLVEMFDLPKGFQLLGFSRRGKNLAVRNAVPLRMGTVIAKAIHNLMEGKQVATRICACGCGRTLNSIKQTLATASCRKRMERWRKQKQETLYFK
jgi:hypothetical protein